MSFSIRVDLNNNKFDSYKNNVIPSMSIYLDGHCSSIFNDVSKFTFFSVLEENDHSPMHSCRSLQSLNLC